jgi:hypothetical protein
MVYKECNLRAVVYKVQTFGTLHCVKMRLPVAMYCCKRCILVNEAAFRKIHSISLAIQMVDYDLSSLKRESFIVRPI